MWYPQNKEELDKEISEFLNQRTEKIPKKINGLILPHAGYLFSGKIMGKAIRLIKNKRIKRAIILGPSHNVYLNGVVTSSKKQWKTPLGEINISESDFEKGEIEHEHSIDNQIPFLQKLKIKEILPLMVGEINNMEAMKIAEKISNIEGIYIFSTDLSHFFLYETAVEKDRRSIEIIEKLDVENFDKIDACGIYPLRILMYLCRIKNFKPHLIEYKNSGDITGEQANVVGYSSFWF